MNTYGISHRLKPGAELFRALRNQCYRLPAFIQVENMRVELIIAARGQVLKRLYLSRHDFAAHDHRFELVALLRVMPRESEISERIEDRPAAIDFDTLHDVRVMAEHEVRASIDCVMPEFHLIFGEFL